MGLFTIFGTSLRALNAYSGAMGIVANNIANSANPNYSRQQVQFSNLSPDRVGGIETGRGVVLSRVSQVVDSFIERRITLSTQQFGRASARSELLRSADTILNEINGTGLSDAMSGYFDSWSALTTEPDNISYRNNVLTNGQNMVDLFHQYNESLTDLQQTANEEIKDLVPILNQKLQEIRDLNIQIADSGSEALSYKDLRREAVNELANYVDLQVVETDDGYLQVYTKAGNPLVNGVQVAEFSVTPDIANDNLYSINVTMGASTTEITNTLREGRLKGLVDVRDTDMPSYIDKLNTLAYTMVTQINSAHSTGYDLDGNTGNLFFETMASSADAALNIEIDVDVLGNPSGIAIAAASDELPGGNTVGLTIVGLGDSTTLSFSGDSNSFLGYWGDSLAEVGIDASIAQNEVDFYKGVLDQVNLDRTSTSGVNIDEEEINLLKFQSAYEASGRLIAIADSILETLITALTV